MQEVQDQNQEPAMEPTGLAEAAAQATAPSEPVAETPSVPQKPANPAPFIQLDEPSEAKKKNDAIYASILASRNQPPAVVITQPVAPRMLEQTRLEMIAGAKQVAAHAANRAVHIERKVLAADGKPIDPKIVASFQHKSTISPAATPHGMEVVHRPADYIPAQSKGQGYIKVG